MVKSFFQKYKHALILLYLPLYLIIFFYLEKNITTNIQVIHVPIDDWIPFNEFFIIPYLLWFFYVAVTVVYFLFTNKKDFYKLCIFLFAGMTIFLIVSYIYPNGQFLRPAVFERDNICVELVKQLYIADTPTNILPSIHVYNSIACQIAICNSQALRKYTWIRNASGVLMTLIILSTMFLKQHSVVDVVLGIIMAYLFYALVYKQDATADAVVQQQPV